MIFIFQNKKVKSKIFHYNFLPENRKAVMERLMDYLLWIVLAVILGAFVYKRFIV